MAPPHAAEGRQEALPKVLVHEAVGDGVAAGRDVGQQMEERLDHGADVSCGAGVVEDDPGPDDVVWGPEDEELDDDHEEHLDDSLFCGAGLLAVGLPHGAVSFETAEGSADGAGVVVEAVVVLLENVGGGGGGVRVHSSALHGQGHTVLTVVVGRTAVLVLAV